MERDGEAVPTSCHIVHLADRVAVLMDTKREILSQVPEILEVIKENAGRMFMPQLVDIVEGLASREGFWLDGVSVLPGRTWWHEARLPTVQLDMQGLLSLAQLFAGLIDFRSRFTATHSSGVAATAESLGRLAGFSPGECQLMRCAGLLHDLGKLAVPESILEKPGKLSHAEFNVIRAHTFYTYRVLEGISALQTINPWAAWHHERLDGAGYPFHISGEDMPLGSRVMAVADTATAVTEDRPYREGMAQDRALDVLRNSAGGSGLDADIVSLYEANFDEVNSARVGAQKAASARYEGLAA